MHFILVSYIIASSGSFSSSHEPFLLKCLAQRYLMKQEKVSHSLTPVSFFSTFLLATFFFSDTELTSVGTIVYLSRAGELLRKIIDKGGDEFYILSYIKLQFY